MSLMSEVDTIRVLVVDDHPVMRSGLRAAISAQPDMDVVGEAADGNECLEVFEKVLPDVTLLDLQMPHMDGFQAMGALRARFPLAPIVVLTTYAGDARVSRALAMGATSYLLKDANGQEIVEAVRRAVDGERVLGTAAARELALQSNSVPLTSRELNVLRLVASGKSNKEISDVLCVSEDAIKARMRSIMSKLEAADRTHAVTMAMRRGFLDNS